MDYMTSQEKIRNYFQYINSEYSVAYAFHYNIFGGITTFNLYFNVITFMQSFKRTFKKSAYIRMHIKFPSYARITSNGPLFRAFC